MKKDEPNKAIREEIKALVGESPTALQVEQVLDALGTVAAKHLAGDLAGKTPKAHIPLPGIGTLALKERKAKAARPGRNPRTGEAVEIPAKPAGWAVAFRPAKALKTLASD